MPSISAFTRVSTTDQDLSIQRAALKAAGCGVIRAEKRSGATTKGRAELQTVLDFLREGDVLVVTRVDRLSSADPKVLNVALRAGRSVGWERATALALLAFLAAQWVREARSNQTAAQI